MRITLGFKSSSDATVVPKSVFRSRTNGIMVSEEADER